MLREHVFDDRAKCADACAAVIARGLCDGIARRGGASLITAGGRSAALLLPRLAANSMIDWSRITVSLSDERWVPSDCDGSNAYLVRNALGNHVKIIELKSDDVSPRAGVPTCDARLKALPFPADMIFLGMGEDGHIASLFPGGDWENEDCGYCMPTRAPVAPFERMSLSPRALLDARRVALMIVGAEKRTVYEQAKSTGPASELPVRLVLQQERLPVDVFIVE